MTFLASLAGERMFFGGDNSAGVGGDLYSATGIVDGACRRSGAWARRSASHAVTTAQRGGVSSRPEDGTDRNLLETAFGHQVEAQLQELYERAEQHARRQPPVRAGRRPRAGDPQDDHRRGHRGHLPRHPGPTRRRVGVPHRRVPAVVRGVPPRRRRGPPAPGQAELGRCRSWRRQPPADGQRAPRAGRAAGRSPRAPPIGGRQRQRRTATRERARSSPTIGWGVLHLFCKPGPPARRARRSSPRSRRL